LYTKDFGQRGPFSFGASLVPLRRAGHNRPLRPHSGPYRLDGNLTQDGTRTYEWDGENRLKAVYPTSPGSGDKKLTFGYDYMGRRVQKQVFGRNANNTAWLTTAESDQRFVYDQWNVVMVVNSSGTPQKKYTWGLDMSGLQGAAGFTPAGMDGSSGIHGAGGIGGLLALEKTTGTNAGSYWYLYDGNGNVMQLLDASTLDIAAVYEYDAYGNTLVAEDWDFSGIVDDNPFRFSTKYCDAELDDPGTPAAEGLYYYGYRYYSPRLGRWLSRDPIGEEGGLNVYEFVRNTLPQATDALGKLGMLEPPPINETNRPWPEPPPPPPQYPNGFSLCGRDIQKDCCCDVVAMVVNNCKGGAHRYLQYYDAPEVGPPFLWGWGFAGSTGPEKAFSPDWCHSCTREPSLLKYGSGSGRSGSVASDAEIRDCISNFPATKPYKSHGKGQYNCWDWAREAAAGCGLNCGG
jgi:RHS repeat-associated protein